MKRKDLNQLLSSIKELLFVDNEGKRSNIINLLEGSRFEEINESSSTIVVSLTSDFSVQLLNESEFKDEFVKRANKVLNSNYEVAFVSRKLWENRNSEETTAELEVLKVSSDSLKGDFTLDNFLASKKGENKMVKQAALSVALRPGVWNPFFIYGGSGLGKTHLLHGIGNKLKETFPGQKIKYLESKDFSDLVYGGSPTVKTKIDTLSINKLTSDLLEYDVLLIDDIQMLQSLPKAREVFFPILSSFINEKKQIVITSDQYPEEMKEFEERFITRFKGGGLLSVTPPDVETAKLILKQKLAAKNDIASIKLTEPALDFIAVSFGSNVRELEGAINKIIFWTIAQDGEEMIDVYTVEHMMEIFDGMTSNRGITIQSIVNVVSKNYQVPTSEILGKTRKAEIVLPRQIAMYLCRKLLDVAYMDIGKHFNRDHSTIISSIRKIEAESKVNQSLSKAIYDLRSKISKDK